MKIPFLAWLLQGIPESIALASVAVVLTTGTLPWSKIVKIGVLQAVSAYTLRLIPFTPGVHVILLITTLSFYTIWICKENLKMSVISSAIAICLLLVFEVSFTTAMVALDIINPVDFLTNTFQRIVIGYPQTLFLFVIALVSNNKGWVLNRFLKRINPYE